MSTHNADNSGFNSAEDIDAIFALQDHAQTAASGDDVMHHLAREVVMADIVTGLSPEGWYVGWEDEWANMDTQFANTVPDLVADMQDMTYVSNGQMAFLSMYVHATAESSGTNIIFRELDTFRKTKGGKWLLTASHVSFPVDRSTGRADTARPVPQRGPVKWSSNPLPGPAVSIEQGERELRQWFGSRVSAATADDVTAHFAQTEDIVVFGPFTDGVYRGADEAHGCFTELFGGVRAVASDVTDLILKTDGELGSIVARLHLTLERSDGTTETFSVRHSDCLRRNGDRWEALMEEVSFVASLKERMALMDLRENRSH